MLFRRLWCLFAVSLVVLALSYPTLVLAEQELDSYCYQKTEQIALERGYRVKNHFSAKTLRKVKRFMKRYPDRIERLRRLSRDAQVRKLRRVKRLYTIVARIYRQCLNGEFGLPNPEEGEGENESTYLVSDNFDPEFWGQQERTEDTIQTVGSDYKELEVRLQDGHTGLGGSSGTERAEIFMFRSKAFELSQRHRLSWEFQLAPDTDVHQFIEGKNRRYYQLHSVDADGRPVADINIIAGVLEVGYTPSPRNSQRVILGSMPAPDPAKGEWISVVVDGHFTNESDGFFNIQVTAGNEEINVHFEGKTAHHPTDVRPMNHKIGTYQGQGYDAPQGSMKVRNLRLEEVGE